MHVISELPLEIEDCLLSRLEEEVMSRDSHATHCLILPTLKGHVQAIISSGLELRRG